jgi:hypothetical protein
MHVNAAIKRIQVPPQNQLSYLLAGDDAAG